MLFFLFTVSGQTYQGIGTNGLVSSFNFTGDLTDYMGNNTAVLVSDAYVDSYGVHFDGQDDSVNITNNGLLPDGSMVFGVGFMVYENVSGAGRNDRLVHARNTGGTERIEILSGTTSDNKYAFELNNDALKSSATPTSDAFIYLFFKWDGEQRCIYVNGTLDNCGAYNTDIMSSINEVYFGRFSTSATISGIGKYFTWWNRNLSDTEIAQLSNDTNYGIMPYTTVTSSAVNYYVCNNGSDSNDGLSPATPFKTLAKVNSLTPDPASNISLCQGDNGLLRGFLHVGSGGTAGNPVTVNSYGSGVAPKIFCSDNSTTWSSYSGNVYVTDKTYPETVNMLYLDTKTSPYPANRTTALGSVTFEGAFYYDSGADKIYLYSGGGNPATAYDGVEIPANQTGGACVYNDQDYVNYKNFEIWYNIDDMLTIIDSDYVNVTGLNLRFCYDKCLEIDGSDNNKNEYNVLKNNNITDGGLRGTVQGGSGECIWIADAKNSVIENNNILRCHGENINGWHISGGTQIINNSIDSCIQEIDDWRGGIYCDGCNQTVVKYNSINNCTLGINLGNEISGYDSWAMEYSHNVITRVKMCGLVADDSGGGQKIHNVNISSNTCWRDEYTSGFFGAYYFQDFNNMTFKDNLVYENYTTVNGALLQLLDNGVNNFTSDYNAWNSTNANRNHFALDSGYYTSLSAFSSGTGQDSNSISNPPIFVSPVTNDFRLISSSILCNSSSTGSYIGALSCSGNNAPTTPAVTLPGNNSIYRNTTTVTFSYSSTDLDGETLTYYIYINDVLNTTTTDESIDLTFTNGDYNFTVKSGDGTENSSLSGYYYFTVSGDNDYSYFFLQRPYFIMANITVNYTNIDGLPTILNADNGVSSGTGVSSGLANDENYATLEYLAGVTVDGYITHTFNTINSSFNNAKFRINYYGDNSGNYITVYCYNYNTSSMTALTTLYGDGVQRDTNLTLNDGCTTPGQNLIVNMTMHRNAGQTVGVYDTALYSADNVYYNVSTEGYLINYSYQMSNHVQYSEFTGLAYNVTDDAQLDLSFSSVYFLDYEFNFSYEIVYNTTINVTIRNNVTGAIINASCTYNGATVYPLTENLSYNSALENNLTCSLLGYQELSTIITPEESAYNFTMTSNTIYIFVYDEDTEERINGTELYLEFFSDTYSANFTTTTGIFEVTFPYFEEYTLRYGGGNYTERFTKYTISSLTNISLYLLSASDGTDILINVFDEVPNPVESADIYVYRYYLEDNSYKLIQIRETNYEGQTSIDLELNSEFYKFMIYYNGELKLETKGAYIVATEITFNIVLQDQLLQDYFTYQGVTGYVSYNEATQNFRFYYLDDSAQVTQGCLYLYQVTATTETLFNTTCETGPSALILSTAQNITGMTYIAKGYITIDGQAYFFDSYVYTFTSPSVYGSTGLFIVIFLTLVAGFIFIWDIQVGLIIIPLPTLLGSLSFIQWIDISTYYTIGLEVIFIIIAISLKRK